MRNIGSEWLKWDLHVHTPFSHLNNQFDKDVSTYLDDLRNSDIAVFGITNYFMITSSEYEQIVKPINESKLALINIEFRLSQPNRTSDFINLHVIFGNHIDYSRIVACLSRVQLINTINGRPAYCNEVDLSSVGYDKALVEFKTLTSQLEVDFCEKDDYVLLAPTNGYGGFRPEKGDGRGNALAVEYDKIAHGIFGSSQKDREYFLDTGRYKGAIPKPVYKSSDAHKNGDVGKEYTWIKARPTYLGLVETLHEPKDRVELSSKPTRLLQLAKSPEKYIKSIEVKTTKDDNEWFDKTKSIPLNSGLVSIIGNKGSGKSALADIIALAGNSAVNEFTFLSKHKFLKDPAHKKYTAQIDLHSNLSYEKKFSQSYDQNMNESVLYLTQAFIENLCDEIPNNDRTRLREEIDKVIFNHVPDEEKLGKGTIIELVEHFKDVINTEINNVNSQIQQKNLEIVKYEELTSLSTISKFEKLIVEFNNKLAQHELVKPKEIHLEKESKDSRLIRRISYWKAKIEARKKDIQLSLSAARLLRDKIERAKQKVISLSESYSNVKTELDDLSLDTNGRVKSDEIVKFKVNLIPLDSEIDSIQVSEKKFKAIIEKCVSLVLKTETHVTQIETKLAGKTKEYDDWRKEQKVWEEKKKTLIGDQGTQNTLEYIKEELRKGTSDYKATLQVLYEDRERLAGTLLQKMQEREEKLAYLYDYSNQKISEIATEFNIEKNDFMSFSSERIISSELTEEFLKYINLSKAGTYYRYGDGRGGYIDKYLESIQVENIDLIKSIPSAILKSLKYTLRDSNDDVSKLNENSIEDQLRKPKVDLYNYLYGFSYIKNQFSIKYGGKPIEFLSPGEKGILLLSFFLLFDNSGKPIIIDQPEENLDNETIYKRLVVFIRKAKLSRQIILVTHNPNLSIVCDSEQVIVAKINRENNNQIKYEFGAIEDKVIKDYALQILEGTKPAFESRINKYSISAIKR